MSELPAAAPALDLESYARWIVDRGLAVPAVFFLELHRPLAGLASHTMLAGGPLLDTMLGVDRCRELREALADPERYEAFIERITDLAHAGEEAG